MADISSRYVNLLNNAIANNDRIDQPVSPERNETYFQANEAFITSLQLNINEQLARRGVAEAIGYERGFQIPITGRWTPDFARFSENFSNNLENINLRATTQTTVQNAPDPNDRVIELSASFSSAAKTIEKPAFTENEKQAIQELRFLNVQLQASLEDYEGLKASATPLQAIKIYLNETAWVSGLDENNNPITQSGFYTPPMAEGETSRFIPDFDDNADDFRLGFGLQQARMNAQNLLNTPEIRSITGMDRFNLDGADSETLRQALDAISSYVDRLPEIYGEGNVPALSYELAELNNFAKLYNQLADDQIQAADQALTQEAYRFTNIFAHGKEANTANVRDYWIGSEREYVLPFVREVEPSQEWSEDAFNMINRQGFNLHDSYGYPIQGMLSYLANHSTDELMANFAKVDRSLFDRLRPWISSQDGPAPEDIDFVANNHHLFLQAIHGLNEGVRPQAEATMDQDAINQLVDYLNDNAENNGLGEEPLPHNIDIYANNPETQRFIETLQEQYKYEAGLAIGIETSENNITRNEDLSVNADIPIIQQIGSNFTDETQHYLHGLIYDDLTPDAALAIDELRGFFVGQEPTFYVDGKLNNDLDDGYNIDDPLLALNIAQAQGLIGKGFMDGSELNQILDRLPQTYLTNLQNSIRVSAEDGNTAYADIYNTFDIQPAPEIVLSASLNELANNEYLNVEGLSNNSTIEDQTLAVHGALGAWISDHKSIVAGAALSPDDIHNRALYGINNFRQDEIESMQAEKERLQAEIDRLETLKVERDAQFTGETPMGYMHPDDQRLNWLNNRITNIDELTDRIESQQADLLNQYSSARLDIARQIGLVSDAEYNAFISMDHINEDNLGSEDIEGLLASQLETLDNPYDPNRLALMQAMPELFTTSNFSGFRQNIEALYNRGQIYNGIRTAETGMIEGMNAAQISLAISHAINDHDYADAVGAEGAKYLPQAQSIFNEYQNYASALYTTMLSSPEIGNEYYALLHPSEVIQPSKNNIETLNPAPMDTQESSLGPQLGPPAPSDGEIPQNNTGNTNSDGEENTGSRSENEADGMADTAATGGTKTQNETPAGTPPEEAPPAGENPPQETLITPDNIPPIPAEVQAQILRMQEAYGVPQTGDATDISTVSAMIPIIQREITGYLAMNSSMDENGLFRFINHQGDKNTYGINGKGALFELVTDENGNKTVKPLMNENNQQVTIANNPAHPLIVELLGEAIANETYTDRLIEKKREILENKIEDLIKPITEDELERDELRQWLGTTQSPDDFSARLRNIKPEMADATLNTLVAQIWGLEQQRRLLDEDHTPNAIEMARYPDLFNNFQQLALTHDVLHYFSGRGPHDTFAPGTVFNPTDGAPQSELTPVDDRIFDARVYRALSQDQTPVDANLFNDLGLTDQEKSNLGLAGKSAYNLDDIRRLARHEIEELAEQRGIPDGQIFKNMTEGNFNPYFEDFTLAWESFGQPNADYLIDNQQDLLRYLWDANLLGEDYKHGTAPEPAFPANNHALLKDLVEDHLAEKGFAYMQGVAGGMRNQGMAQAWGDFNSLGTVNTLVNGVEKEMTGHDLGLRGVMRLRGSNFEHDYGLTKSPNWTFESAIAKLEERGEHQAASALRNEVEEFMENHSAYSYFNLRSLNLKSEFNLRKDYQDLRMERYFEVLNELTAEETAKAEHFVLDRDEVPESLITKRPEPAKPEPKDHSQPAKDLTNKETEKKQTMSEEKTTKSIPSDDNPQSFKGGENTITKHHYGALNFKKYDFLNKEGTEYNGPIGAGYYLAGDISVHLRTDIENHNGLIEIRVNNGRVTDDDGKFTGETEDRSFILSADDAKEVLFGYMADSARPLLGEIDKIIEENPDAFPEETLAAADGGGPSIVPPSMSPGTGIKP